MNVQLVDSLVKIIQSLSIEEKTLLEEKLLLENKEPSTYSFMQTAENSHCFQFLNDEPDLYSDEDGEPINHVST